jgi:hypothetical protein
MKTCRGVAPPFSTTIMDESECTVSLFRRFIPKEIALVSLIEAG